MKRGKPAQTNVMVNGAVAVLLAIGIALGAWLGIARSARASAGLPTAFFDPYSAEYASYRDMTSSELTSRFNEFRAKGYLMVDIEAMDAGGRASYSGVWQENTDNRGWAMWRDLTGAQLQQKIDSFKAAGYRPIDLEAYLVGGQRRYAGIWMQNKESLGWVAYIGVNDADFKTRFDAYRHNYLPVDVEAYPSGGSLLYGMVWVRNTGGLDWAELRDQTDGQFAAKFTELGDKHRMIDVESYRHNGTQYYAGIWIEDKANRAWAERRDLTSQAFADYWATKRDQGYRPIKVTAYSTASGVRYAGIWRQNSIRPAWNLKDEVDEMVADHIDDHDVPGLSVAIADNGQFLYLRGFGYADVGDKKIATSRTVYRLASVSKAVAGVLSMRLVDKGKVNLDNTTRKYASYLPKHHTHTPRQLLSNRSGVRHYLDGDDPTKDVDQQYDTAKAASGLFSGDELQFTPGKDYLYSTHGYTLLGAALEGATGKSAATLVVNELTTPYGLDSLRPEDRGQANPDRSSLYSGGKEATADNVSWKLLGGGLESSAYDLARLGIKLLDGTVLKSQSRTTMWTKPDNLKSYGLGWSVGTEDGTAYASKDGEQLGASSYLRIYPDRGIVIAVLTNQRDSDAPALAKDIGKLLLAEGLLSDTTADATADATAASNDVPPATGTDGAGAVEGGREMVGSALAEVDGGAADAAAPDAATSDAMADEPAMVDGDETIVEAASDGSEAMTEGAVSDVEAAGDDPAGGGASQAPPASDSDPVDEAVPADASALPVADPEDLGLGDAQPSSGSLTDPLGIDLTTVGFAAGGRPCADEAHVASVVDAFGRYVAFCEGAGGAVSAIQVVRADQPLLALDGMTAVDAFLSLTPDTVDVPAALIEDAAGYAAIDGRGVSDEAIAYQSPDAAEPPPPAAVNACTSAAYFKSKYCGIIQTWADPNAWSQQAHWCNEAKSPVATQRTASAEGVAAHTGREIVAACGSEGTHLHRVYRGGVTNEWKTVYMDAIQPNHVVHRWMFHTDHVQNDAFGNPRPARDLRFRVVPRSGGWYRHTGGFVRP